MNIIETISADCFNAKLAEELEWLKVNTSAGVDSQTREHLFTTSLDAQGTIQLRAS